jgi:ABC-type transport system substrate-binding protein
MLSAAIVFPAALLLGLLPWSRRRKLISTTLLAVAFAAFAGLSGCATNPTQAPATATPIGTSTVTITLTGPDSVVQTVPITLTVIQSTPVTAVVRRPRTSFDALLEPALLPLQQAPERLATR